MMNLRPFKKWFLFLTICIAAIPSFAQTSHIGGVVNKYAGVTAIDYCNNNITVDDVSPFFMGQKIILIQMAGASVDGSATTAYGDIQNYNNGGNYEVQVIKSIVGSVIEFTFAIVRNYDVAGAVQIVSLPEYQIAAVDSVLTSLDFNGIKGGVIAIKADTIILNDSVRARGTGFRGGALINDNNAQPCYNNGIGGSTAYYCATLDCGAAKGNGIGNAGYGFGRGKNANGGGGGDDHNTGGGGGANYGAGGVGGTRSNTSVFSCPGPAAGIGGAPLTYSNALNKIFMGGGGGAGDENNNEGTEGGHGGGIVIFMANTLIGNNKRINAGGNWEWYLASSDGAGGGGGGGTVLLFVDNYSGNIIVNTTGGKGGNLDNGGSATACMGPGGGGGGGMLWVKTNSIPVNINYIDSAGYNGKNTFGLAPPACPFGTTNGAQPGTVGGSLTNLNMVIADVPFVKLIATSCCDTTVCPNQPIRMIEADTSSYPATVFWSNGSSAHSFVENVSSTTSYTVTVSDHHNCQVVLSHTATVYNNIVGVVTCCDTIVCSGGTVGLNVTAPAVPVLTYMWSTGESTTSITPTVFTSQTFFVTVTDPNGCTIQQSADVTVGNTFPNFNVCCDTTVCAGAQITFVASTTASPVSYSWSSGQNTSSITEQILSSQIFTVTVSNTSGCSATSSVSVTVNNIPPVFSVCCDTTFCPGATLLANAISDSSLTYQWSSGQNTASISQQVFASQIFTVTATNSSGCTASQSVNAIVNNLPPSFSICCDTSFCISGTVQTVATSTEPLLYHWSNGDTTVSSFQTLASSQSIFVTVTDLNGCTAEDFIDVLIQNVPPAFSVCCDTVICPNGNATFAVIASPTLQFNYNWSSGEQTDVITKQIFTAQNFVVTVTDQGGCTGTGTVNATINNNVVDFSVCCDTVVCQGNVAVFVASSLTPVNYVWSNGETTSMVTEIISAPQTFTVTATNVSGCSGVKTVQATISVPQTTITAAPDTNITLGQTVQLMATGDSGTSYQWLPASGLDDAAIQNPKAKPDSTTTYCVTATDIYGCTAMACYRIEILLPEIKIPDAFSPNGDGVNDEFIIFPLSSTIEEIKIYNRWGEVVFYAKGNAAWNGTYKGNAQQAGNFFLQVSYTNPLNPGKTNTVVKDVILVR